MNDTEHGEGMPVLGTNPRLRQLARSFVTAKRNRRRFRSPLFQKGPGHFQQLLQVERREDYPVLLESLQELRVLLEEHMHLDAERVLGEI